MKKTDPSNDPALAAGAEAAKTRGQVVRDKGAIAVDRITRTLNELDERARYAVLAFVGASYGLTPTEAKCAS